MSSSCAFQQSVYREHPIADQQRLRCIEESELPARLRPYDNDTKTVLIARDAHVRPPSAWLWLLCTLCLVGPLFAVWLQRRRIRPLYRPPTLRCIKKVSSVAN